MALSMFQGIFRSFLKPKAFEAEKEALFSHMVLHAGMRG